MKLHTPATIVVVSILRCDVVNKFCKRYMSGIWNDKEYTAFGYITNKTIVDRSIFTLVGISKTVIKHTITNTLT